MSTVPSPDEIFERSCDEGRRRLEMSTLELVSTGFIAGFTIVFGVVGVGVVESLVEPTSGAGLAKLAGALTFGIGLVFLVVGRSELFSENVLDPVAAALTGSGSRPWLLLVRLWLVILTLNLFGAALLGAVFSVQGALPDGAPDALVRIAEKVAAKGAAATFARAVAAGTLIALLSFMLQAVDSMRGRMTVAYLAGFFLALGPFDHVVVSATHLVLGVWFDGAVGYGDVLRNLGVSASGNLVGGLLFVTASHAARAKGEGIGRAA